MSYSHQHQCYCHFLLLSYHIFLIMTPRTRNNGRGRLMAAGPVNTTGFPALPVETLYEITEHLSLALVGTPAARSSQSCDYICLRTRTMRSLAETCRRLRSIFLALSFESLEAWGNLDRFCRKKDLARELATQLVRQIEIVTIRNSALAQYVKFVERFYSRHIHLTAICVKDRHGFTDHLLGSHCISRVLWMPLSAPQPRNTPNSMVGRIVEK